jgi:MFS family permease
VGAGENWLGDHHGHSLDFAYVPMILFLLLGGVAVDRYPRVKLMLASDLLRGVVVMLVAVLAFSQRLEIWHILVASLVFGLVDAVFQPAYTALVPELLPQEVWPSANSLSSMSAQLGRIAGPALGAVLLGLGGTSLAFAFNSFSFFLSALCLVPLLRFTAASPRVGEATQPNLLQDVREGIATVLRSPVLWLAILMGAVASVTLGAAFNVGLPFLVKEHLQGDATLLGILYAIFPVGYLLGGVWFGSKTQLRWRGWSFYLSFVVAGLGLLVLGLPVPLVIIGMAALINGAALEIANLVWNNILQEQVPLEKLGRVSSIDMMGSFLLLPLGFALAGWAIDTFGPAPLFILSGTANTLFAMLALIHPVVRRLD